MWNVRATVFLAFKVAIIQHPMQRRGYCLQLLLLFGTFTVIITDENGSSIINYKRSK